MGRIVYLMMGIVAINLALLLFSCSSWDASGQCVPSSNIWSFVTNPSEVDSSSLWTTLFGSVYGLAAIAGTIILIGRDG